jgi:hypothetical protein
MSEMNFYTANFQNRFLLKRNNFWAGFLFFFGGKNPYKKSVKKIMQQSIEDSLKGDIQQLSNDFRKAIDNHSAELPHIRGKGLIDACE